MEVGATAVLDRTARDHSEEWTFKQVGEQTLQRPGEKTIQKKEQQGSRGKPVLRFRNSTGCGWHGVNSEGR